MELVLQATPETQCPWYLMIARSLPSPSWFHSSLESKAQLWVAIDLNPENSQRDQGL
jgi:hypothetical protein